MKILLLAVVEFVLILGASEANGEKVTLVDRQLLSDTNLGRKANFGAYDQTDSLTNGDKGITKSGESKTSTEGDQNKNGIDGNGNSGNSGSEGSGSSTSGSHHHFTTDLPPQRGTEEFPHGRN